MITVSWSKITSTERNSIIFLWWGLDEEIRKKQDTNITYKCEFSPFPDEELPLWKTS